MGVQGRIADLQPFAELAQGPTTVVYKAYQRSLDRTVLLKVLRPALGYDEELARRFEAEARLVAQIQHPNVVAIHAYGRADDQTYLAAEFVEGFDLRDVLAQGPLPPELAAFVLREAALGLQAAHAHGILHRDLKPSNMLISHEGHVKLTDFGMASLVEDDAAPEVRGTPGYLAPELVRGAPPDRQADLFSLGATCYEMLAGRPPFVGTETNALLDAVLHHDPLPRLERFADLPAGLRRICARLLAKNPDDRYPDADALLADLEAFRAASDLSAGRPALAAYLDDPEAYRKTRPRRPAPASKTAPDDAPERPDRRAALPGRPAERRRLRYALGLAVTVLVVGGVGGTLFFRNEPPPTSQTTDAPEEAATRLPEIDTRLPVRSDVAAEAADEPATESLDPAQRPVGLPLSQDTLAPALSSLDGAVSSEDTVSLGDDPPPGAATLPEPAAAAPTDATGTLHVVVAPWADVYVDGEPKGRTPLQPLRLPAGTHDVVLKHPSFPEYAAPAAVQAGQADTLVVSLWTQVGRLSIYAHPWAEVRVDGVVRDTTPVHSLIVGPGEHTLELRNPDLGVWPTTFTIGAGATDTLRFNLNRLLGR